MGIGAKPAECKFDHVGLAGNDGHLLAYGGDERAFVGPLVWQRFWRSGKGVEIIEPEQVLHRDWYALQGAMIFTGPEGGVGVPGLRAGVLFVPNPVGAECVSKFFMGLPGLLKKIKRQNFAGTQRLTQFCEWLVNPAAAHGCGSVLAELAHGDRRVTHAVGKAPLIVIPTHDAHQRAIDHLGLIQMENG